MAHMSQQDWDATIRHLGEVIGASAAKDYQGKPVARLVAAIPYLSGAEDPDRQAVSNLLVLHAATKARALFDHRETDNSDVLRRLSAFDFGKSADPQVVQYGLNLLGLVMLSDHERDLESDKKAGKYNPLAAGAWDGNNQKKQLENALAANPKAKALFDGYMTPAAAAVQGWWIS